MDNEVFELVVAAVKRSGIPLTRISRRAGLSNNTVINWVHGVNKTAMGSSLGRVAAVLGMTIEVSGGRARLVAASPRHPIVKRSPAPSLSGSRMRMLLRSLQ